MQLLHPVEQLEQVLLARKAPILQPVQNDELELHVPQIESQLPQVAFGWVVEVEVPLAVPAGGAVLPVAEGGLGLTELENSLTVKLESTVTLVVVLTVPDGHADWQVPLNKACPCGQRLH